MLAVVFDSVGFGEWFVLLAVVLIVVGPKRLPHAARTIGGYMAKFRRAADSFKRQIMEMDTEFERGMNDAAQDLKDSVSVPEAVTPPPDAYFRPPEPEPPVAETPAAEASGQAGATDPAPAEK